MLSLLAQIDFSCQLSRLFILH